MSENLPKFWIYAVVDGESRGLYARKQKSEHSEPEKVYFHITNGLKPTAEILKACDGNAKCLYTENDREVRIFNEIVSYAMNVALHGRKGEFELTQPYLETRGYQEVVDRYYEDPRMSPFKDFFESAATLKKHVLKNVRGKHHLAEGTAEQFGVLSPHAMMADDFEYLEPIKDVLKIGIVTPPRRLRKAGPIAVDFDQDFDQRVFRRSKPLEDLRSLVLEESVSMLIGKAATGKTVLARQLGYELHTKENWAVYFFDCDGNMDFQWRSLAGDINSVRGIFILENIHLATREFQLVYNKLDEHPCRHVLLTTRPSFRESQDKKGVDLCEIEAIELKPFDDVDKIVDHFALRHPEVAWSSTIRESIKKISEKSFWLLSYALEGYVGSQGKGESGTWLEESVRGDLEDLERLNPTYPEVLVALSPLYRNEVQTEETFLREALRFEPRMLNDLVDRGEITRRRNYEEGYCFYGLPHSALAHVYWKYGGVYRRRRKLPGYEEYLYEYATAEVPNGLRAALKTRVDIRERVLDRIRKTGKMINVISAVAQIGPIKDWVERIIWWEMAIEGYGPGWGKTDILRGHSDIAARFQNLSGEIPCCELKQNDVLSCMLNIVLTEDCALIESARFMRIVASKISQCDDLFVVSRFFEALYRYKESAIQQLIQFLDFRKLAVLFSRIRELNIASRFLWNMLQLGAEFRQRFASQLQIDELVCMILTAEDIECANVFIIMVRNCDNRKGCQLEREVQALIRDAEK